ncbi:MAG: peptidase U32 family protein [Chitinophagaceae bacterium]
MLNTKNTIELMSPAGNFEAMMAAIQSGCDAVYFGVEQLNMRAKSTINFTLNDLEKITAIAQQHYIKTYLTLNTVLFNHDLSIMKKILEQAKQHHISAVIAADHAVLLHAKKMGIPIHISTQSNISNIESVEFFAEYADTIVLARELSISQVAEIIKEIERRKIKGPSGNLVAIEIFGHGALCMAVSGKCYLSLHTHNASANRGACIQNCRHQYIVTDKEDNHELEIDNEYIMSAKDLCTIGFLDKIIHAGVKVLKIEGRGRSVDYVYTVTQCYKEALSAIEEGTYTTEKIKAWDKRLATVYNRGFWEGYYLGKKIGEWSNEYGSKATKKKIYIAKGKKYFAKKNIGEFLIESNDGLFIGDQIIIIGPTTGLISMHINELWVENKPVQKAKKGDIITIPIQNKIRASDKIYKIV